MSATSIWHPSEGRIERSGTVGGVLRRWVAFTLGLAVVVGAAWWTTNTRLFDVRDLRVAGNARLSAAEVTQAALLDATTNVLWMSTADVEARLERHPWIRDAEVSRVLPGRITVTVRERSPVAVLLPGALLLAGDGTVLGTAEEGAALPAITIPKTRLRAGDTLAMTLPQVVAARAMPADMLGVIEHIGPGRNGTLAVRTRDGVEVLFGDASDAAAKWEALRGVLAWTAENGVTPEYVDVRAPIAPALRPAGASTPGEGGEAAPAGG